jgi:hypothetical protein
MTIAKPVRFLSVLGWIAKNRRGPKIVSRVLAVTGTREVVLDYSKTLRQVSRLLPLTGQPPLLVPRAEMSVSLFDIDLAARPN